MKNKIENCGGKKKGSCGQVKTLTPKRRSDKMVCQGPTK